MTVSVRELTAVTRFGARLFWRDRVALGTSVSLFLGLGIGLPLLMDKVVPGDPGTLLGQHLGTLMMVLVMVTFVQPVVALTTRRDQLLLKRMRATGLRDRDILGGEIVNLVAQSTLLTVVVSVALYALTDLPVPRDPVLYLVSTIAGAVVLCLLGTAFTGLVPRAELAAVMAMPVFFLTGVSANGFGPFLKLLPGWVGTLLALLPTGAVAEVAHVAYAADGTLAGDLRAAAVAVLKLAPWAAFGVFATVRWFRWETRRS